MNLVLERLADKTTPVDVIVTADTRGNYIEHMIKRCGGNALRVPDGYKAFGALKNIVRDSYEKAHSFAVALDGPLGPRHEPKKLAFYLSEHAEEAFVGISLSYSSCIRLTRRWDKYVIPLSVYNSGRCGKRLWDRSEEGDSESSGQCRCNVGRNIFAQTI